jgi:hypothetical protein
MRQAHDRMLAIADTFDPPTAEIIRGLNRTIDQLLASRRTHAAELRRVAVEAICRCASAVDAEPELPGAPPRHVVKAMESIGPTENARAAVRATKKGIAERIAAIDVTAIITEAHNAQR